MIRRITGRDPQAAQSRLLRLLVWAAGALTVGVSSLIVLYILLCGIPQLNAGLFSPKYTSANCSLLPALYNTLVMLCVTLAMVLPVGIGAAVYLSEYASSSGIAVRLICIALQTLSGIPSIVYGLFGLLFFVTFLGWGFSLLAGCCTLAVMVLPVVVRTAQEALLSVPTSLREGAFALGSGKVRCVFCIVLPAAVPGIASGVTLAVGRVIGESAALIYTAGTVAKMAHLGESGRTLSVHLWALWNEGLSVGSSYATALILMVVVLALNFASGKLEKLVSRRNLLP